MTVSVRPWAEISADLRRWNMVLTREAADWGDALATEKDRYYAEILRLEAQLREVPCVVDEHESLAVVVAAVHTALDQYDTIASSGNRNMKAAEACVSAIAKAVGR